MCPNVFLEAIWFGFEITKKPLLKDVSTNIGMTYNHLQPLVSRTRDTRTETKPPPPHRILLSLVPLCNQQLA